MRPVAVVIAVNLAAITAATLILHELHPRDAIEQIQRDQQGLALQNARIERMLAAALNRYPASAISAPQASTSAPEPPAANTAGNAAQNVAPEERAAHDELVQAGNALVDRTLVSGVIATSDFDKLAAATRGLNAEERIQIIARLSAAMNANQVRFEHSISSP